MDTPRLSYRCDRTWDDLEGQGPQRTCVRCDQQVHDLDAMEPVARAALLGSPWPACVRFLTVALLATAIPAGAQEQPVPDDDAPVVPGEGPLPFVSEPQKVMGALDRSWIEAHIQAQSARLAEIYAERLSLRPGLAGRISVRFTMQDKVVIEAVVQSSTVGDPVLEQAVLDVVRGLRFAHDARIVVVYPFLFAPAPAPASER